MCQSWSHENYFNKLKRCLWEGRISNTTKKVIMMLSKLVNERDVRLRKRLHQREMEAHPGWPVNHTEEGAVLRTGECTGRVSHCYHWEKSEYLKKKNVPTWKKESYFLSRFLASDLTFHFSTSENLEGQNLCQAGTQWAEFLQTELLLAGHHSWNWLTINDSLSDSFMFLNSPCGRCII